MYVCMYVCMFVCLYLCMYVSMYVCMYVCHCVIVSLCHCVIVSLFQYVVIVIQVSAKLPRMFAIFWDLVELRTVSTRWETCFRKDGVFGGSDFSYCLSSCTLSELRAAPAPFLMSSSTSRWNHVSGFVNSPPSDFSIILVEEHDIGITNAVILVVLWGISTAQVDEATANVFKSLVHLLQRCTCWRAPNLLKDRWRWWQVLDLLAMVKQGCCELIESICVLRTSFQKGCGLLFRQETGHIVWIQPFLSANWNKNPKVYPTSSHWFLSFLNGINIPNIDY